VTNAVFLQAREAYRQAAVVDSRLAPHAELAFRRIDELGRGGMGAVFRVCDLRLPGQREAALKVMLDAQDADGVKRFWREIEITARLEHPAIPPIYEAGVTPAGHPYMLMRLIGGETFEHEIDAFHSEDAPLTGPSVKRLLEALLKVAEAVAYAHGEGVIHRDLKPANVMLGTFGEAVVMDWGLARDRRSGQGAERPQAGLTQEGTTLGTPGYMPPEQAGGDPVDERADVFALGAILVTLLTGEPPITGATTMNKVSATIQGKITLPRERRRDVPPELNSLAAAALKADEAERLPSASAFAADLRAFLHGELLDTHHYSAGERLRLWARRRPTTLVALTLGALLLAGASGLFAQRAQLGQTRRDAARASEAAAREEAERERVQEIQTALFEAAVAAEAGDLERAQDRIADAEKLAGEEAWLHLSVARLLRNAGAFAAGRTHAKKALDLDPTNSTAYYLLQDLSLISASSRASRAQLVSTLRAMRGEAEVPQALSRCLDAWEALEKREPRAALELLEGDVNADHQVWALRAQAHLDLREMREAERAATEAIRRLGRSPRPYLIRALARSELALLESAEFDAKRALELSDGELADAYRVLAFLRSRRPDPKASPEAIRLLDEALKRAPGDSSALGLRALLHLRADRPKEALRDATEALQHDPDCADALYARGNAYYQAGRLSAAFSDLDHFVRLRPKSLVGYEARGQVQLARGEFAKAAQDYGRGLALNSRDPTLYLHRGQAYIALKRFPEAKADMLKVLELAPNHPQKRRVIGTLRRLAEMGY
jgi:tetratricopeptide (TPR) repeat protein